MRSVSLETLMNRLSEYVRLAEAGETVLVTDRYRVVAELVPPRERRREFLGDAVLAEAVRRGWLTVPLRVSEGAPPRLPVAAAGAFLAELTADRGERRSTSTRR